MEKWSYVNSRSSRKMLSMQQMVSQGLRNYVISFHSRKNIGVIITQEPQPIVLSHPYIIAAIYTSCLIIRCVYRVPAKVLLPGT